MTGDEIDAFWRGRYRSGDTPWHVEGGHPELAERLAGGELGLVPGARAYVPGCGRGHDALLLSRAGAHVTAVDLIDELAPLLAGALERHGGRFIVADALAFTPEPRADLLFEHTFFCAIPPERRADYGAMARRALLPGGRLFALVFPIGRPPELGGPPHAVTTAELARALGDEFELVLDEPVRQRLATRPWEERWASFRRR